MAKKIFNIKKIETVKTEYKTKIFITRLSNGAIN